MIVIKGGTINTVSDGIIEDGVIIVKDGKIANIGKGIEIPSDAEVIDASNCYITPGLIDAHTHISTFSEPHTRFAMMDGNEMSNPITPFIRAMDALNPFDFAVDRVRDAGFTTVCTLPGSANIIGGTGITFKLRGHTAEIMIIPGTEQMKMALGENPRGVYGHDKKLPMTRMGVAGLWRQTLSEAKDYSDKLKEAETDPSKAPKYDFKLESLVKVIRKEMKARIHCHRSDDIITAIRIAEEFDLDYSLEHATEGYKVVDVLAQKNPTCVIGPLFMEPVKQELHAVKEENAGILSNSGVEVCISADTGSGTAWLPAQIGHLIRRGLKEEDAFKSVTINPARLLGVDDRVGTLEIGKDADIAIFDGFPFSSMTLCRMTMIDGVVYKNTLSE